MEAVFASLGGRLAEKHQQLANTTALCSDFLPDRQPVSRAKHIKLHYLDAKSVLQAVRSMKDNQNIPEPALNKLTRELEAHCSALQKLYKLENEPAHNLKASKTLQEQLKPASLWGDASASSPKKKGEKYLRDAFTQHWDAINEGRSGKKLLETISHPDISQQEYLKLFVENQLKHAGVAKSDMPDLGVLVGEGRAEILGSNPEAWDPLNKDLQFTHQGKTCEVKSTITPSAHFLKDNLVNPQFKRGVAAGDRLSQTRHIPNLAQTELKNGEGKKIFSALRHGVLDAYKVSGKNLRALPETKLRSILTDLVGSDPAKIDQEFKTSNPEDLVQLVRSNKKEAKKIASMVREHASANMARELVSAALINNPEKHAKALAGEEVSIALDSISLVTPDPIRGRSSKSEKNMLKRQAEALQKMQGSQQLSLRNADGEEQKVKVKVHVNAMNFGVNAGAISTTGRLNRISRLVRAITGWGFSARLNNPALNNLVGHPRDQAIGGQTGEKISELSTRRRSLIEANRNIPDPDR